ncbi:hypothetical protein Q5H93_14705 [Hymenobacter sp. ASUV-10]|uniref:Ig-like domain-containing protein n=1 Tax=Hymenobacter aranciens TaxID=3063996 RepID=A0ABT9BCK0_9BACT|nr:hypothetical protein [Hymenobacter sp. ASUV-10]MDO7875991.1 hypothetical protein [Hymenobacter sp. ASUV-10]
MPGERLAKLTLSVNDLVAGGAVRLKLRGTWVAFARGGSNQMIRNGLNGMDFYQFKGYPDLAQDVDSLLAAIRWVCTDLAAAYVVSAKRELTVPGGDRTFAFDVEAAVYQPSYDLDFTDYWPEFNRFAVVANRTTIRPVVAYAAISNATIFGSPTGSILVFAENGNAGVYTYVWQDTNAPTTPGRSNVPNGTYLCTITDASGAYTVLQVVVGSDPRLDVLVARTGDDVTLVPSGGLPGYTYAWADGPTTATRPGLAAGTYTCTVTDARGATRVVSVVVEPYRYYWSLNPVTLYLDAGADYRLDPATKPNLSFVCQVWVEKGYLSGEYEQIGAETEQPADAAGRTVFDVQALLDAYLGEQLPALNEGRIQRAGAHFRRFYLKHAEKFGEPPVPAPLSQQQQHYVVLGGLDFLNYPTGAWLAYQQQVKPFLTWEPNDKKVLPAQPEYLAFMPLTASLTGFRQWVRLRFADGSTQTRRHEEVPTGVSRFEVYHLPAGYAQLQLTDPPGLDPGPKSVVAWDVWVSDLNDVPVSEVRRYQLDQAYYPYQRFFVYLNSLGGWNTLAVTGEAKRTLEVEAEDADRGLPPGYDPLLGTSLALQRSAQGQLSLATAPRRRAQLLHDQELLLSKRVLLQSGGQYWPGTITAKSVTLVDEAQGLGRLELEFKLAKSPLFTPRLPVVPAGRPIASVAGGEGAQP